jgi:hypothetical protein
MASSTPNFEQTDYIEVPFVPSATVRAREAAAARAMGVTDESESTPNYFLRSIAGGLAGAAIGAVCYVAFIAATGITLRLLTILVGYIVGKAMTLASGERGGREYQITAVILTYLSISTGEAVLLWWWASQERPVTLTVGHILGLAKVGLMFPVVNFAYSPRYGIIGLFLLCAGIRAAYRMTSGRPGASRHPFKR